MDSHLLHGYIYEDENGTFSLVCKCCNSKLEQLDQFRQHLSEHSSTTPCTEMSKLPEECLTKIFKCLSPNQLVNVSQVCRQFKSLVEKVFDPGPIQIKCGPGLEATGRSLFSSGRGRVHNRIENTNFTQFNFVCRSSYEIAFPSLMRRLTIPRPHVNNIWGFEKLFQFIRDNCSNQLISLSFSDRLSTIRFPLLESNSDRRIYGEIAKYQLKHLKHLRLKDPPFEHLYDQLLQYTEQLKTLSVINHCGSICMSQQDCLHFDGSWTNYIYPELESICVYTNDPEFDLMPMLLRNPKLRSVACNSLATIRSILQSDITFDYVAMLFSVDDDTFYGLRRLHRYIVEFGQSKRFRTFELALNGKCPGYIHRIEEIPNLTGLHPDLSILFDISEGDFVTRLPTIEKLCMINYYGSHRTEELTKKIDWIFPDLRELRINAYNSWFYTYRYSSCFKQFALGILYDPKMFEKLEILHYENDEEVEFSWDDIVDINTIRSKRSSPSKVTVYLDPEHFHKFDRNVVELQFIEIKPWVHGGCQICRQRDVGYNN